MATINCLITTRILFVRKENKNNDIYATICLRCFRSNQSVNKRTRRIHALLMTENSIRTLRPSDALQNGATLTQRQRGDELLNKCRYFYFLCIQKYSLRFIKFRLNHWWQMDYFDDVFYNFLGLDIVNYLAVKGTLTSLPVFIQNILNCVPRTKSFYGFGTTWG